MILRTLSYKQFFFLDLGLFNNDMLKAAERSKATSEIGFCEL
jgi:hypothetical protein